MAADAEERKARGVKEGLTMLANGLAIHLIPSHTASVRGRKAQKRQRGPSCSGRPSSWSRIDAGMNADCMRPLAKSGCSACIAPTENDH